MNTWESSEVLETQDAARRLLPSLSPTRGSTEHMDKTLTKGDRLWSTLMEMARIGAIAEDGCCRLSLTDEDRQARDLFARWCRDAGCVLRVDPFGNMFAIRPGSRNDAPAILVGSHLDTQP